MKIVVITGSHHKNGTSAHLAAAFIRGAEETGHEVCRFDAAFGRYILVLPVKLATIRTGAVPLQMI